MTAIDKKDVVILLKDAEKRIQQSNKSQLNYLLQKRYSKERLLDLTEAEYLDLQWYYIQIIVGKQKVEELKGIFGRC